MQKKNFIIKKWATKGGNKTFERNFLLLKNALAEGDRTLNKEKALIGHEKSGFKKGNLSDTRIGTYTKAKGHALTHKTGPSEIKEGTESVCKGTFFSWVKTGTFLVL